MKSFTFDWDEKTIMSMSVPSEQYIDHGSESSKTPTDDHDHFDDYTDFQIPSQSCQGHGDLSKPLLTADTDTTDRDMVDSGDTCEPDSCRQDQGAPVMATSDKERQRGVGDTFRKLKKLQTKVAEINPNATVMSSLKSQMQLH